MLEDEAGLATDPKGFLRSGALVGGNKPSTSEGSFPLALLERGAMWLILSTSRYLVMGEIMQRPILSELKINWIET